MALQNDRFFVNGFNDYIVEKKEFQASEVQIKEKLEHSFFKLLKKFEKSLHQKIDWNDISVYTGVSGYVLLYVLLADYYNDNKYLQTASQLNLKSLKLLKRSKISFLCGDSGPLAIGAIIFEKQGEYSNVEKCIYELSDMQGSVMDLKSDLPDELLYGRVGYLYALLLVNQKVSSKKIEPTLIRSVISMILESGQRLSKSRKLKVPLAFEWHKKNYLGAAHGVCGILTILLQVKELLSERELNDLVRPTIDDLTRLFHPSGNLASSEGSSSGDKLVHWCHGAPAAVFMFAMAYKVFGDERYLLYAEKAAQVIWDRGLLKKGYGLCHGTAGNAYALLYMYQISGKDKYLYMATQFAFWCRDYGKHGCQIPDRPWSMFEGLAGTVYFMVDFLKKDSARFPGFIL